MTQLFLHFLNAAATFKISSSAQKKPYLTCVDPFFNFGI